MTHPITVPRANANDDVVLLVEWLCPPGTHIHAEQPLYIVETSKATEEIVSDAAGYVRPVIEPGQMVAVQQVIGFLTATAEEPLPEVPARPEVQATENGGHAQWDRGGGAGHVEQKQAPDQLTPHLTSLAPSSSDHLKITVPARALAESLGISWQTLPVPSDGIIRSEHVRAYQAHQVPSTQTAFTDVNPANYPGRIDPEFLAQLRADPSAITQLPSDAKIALYRKHGALIGPGVSIGQGTYLDAQYLSLGAETVLAENILIRCRRFNMGELGEIGAGAKILCRDFLAGDGVNIRFRAVIVQGGGMHSCRIGDDCFIAYDTYINTDRDVTLARHVCLAPGVRIYTHRKWLNPLDGFASGFAPVEIGDDCHLGPNVVVLPGVTIAPRVTVMANAVVASNIPAERLIGGSPAKTIVEGPMYHKPLNHTQRQAAFLQILRECLLSFEGWGAIATNVALENARAIGGTGGGGKLDLTWQGQSAAIIYVPVAPSTPARGRALVLSFDPPVLALASDHLTAFDLSTLQIRGVRDPLSDFFRGQLDFYGLHFTPRQRRLPTSRYE